MSKADEMRRKQEERLKFIKNNPRDFLLGRSADKAFFLGQNSITKRPVKLKQSDFQKHWHILGATGKGKSKFIEHIVRTLIDRKEGLCLIDPHGDLYESLKGYVVRKGLDKKVILIDPNSDDALFGLNYLERGAHIVKDLDAHVGMVMRAVAKVFGGEDQDTLPRLQHWLRNTLYTLMEQGYTLVEMLDFLSLADPAARLKIVESLNDPYIKKDWQEFEALRKAEKEIRLESVFNRAAKFVGSERMRRIVGQAKSTINFRQAMDEGKVIIVNLSPAYISKEAQKMLGVMIVDLIVEAAFSRIDISEKQRKPFYFIVDEFGEFVCDDFAYALEALRKYGVFLFLSNQQMDQLKSESQRVYHSVMANCRNKVTFGISREDAEVMAKELFTGMIRGDRIKDEIYQTKFWPTESTRIVSSNSRSEGTSSGQSSARGRGEVSAEGAVQMFGPDGPTFFADVLAQNIIESSGSSSSYSEGSSSVSNESQSFSESEVPWYEYEPFRELSSRTYFSPEELLEKFISWIKNQATRQAQIKVDTKRTVPMVTPYVEDLRVYPPSVVKFEEGNKKVYAKRVEEIDAEIKTRRDVILNTQVKNNEDIDFRE
jgi:hypothetical protein